MSKPTSREKYDFISQVVDTAIIQSSESSRLRDWLIFRLLKMFSNYQHHNAAEMALQTIGDDLIIAFENIYENDTEFLKFLERKELKGPVFTTSTAGYQEPEMPWLNRKTRNATR